MSTKIHTVWADRFTLLVNTTRYLVTTHANMKRKNELNKATNNPNKNNQQLLPKAHNTS